MFRAPRRNRRGRSPPNCARHPWSVADASLGLRNARALLVRGSLGLSLAMPLRPPRGPLRYGQAIGAIRIARDPLPKRPRTPHRDPYPAPAEPPRHWADARPASTAPRLPESNPWNLPQPPDRVADWPRAWLSMH